MVFQYFEFLVAWRYLKSKRKDGFISVITWLSLVGIMLGVATLVIVMSVMNGFREEMLAKILGMNGHVVVMPEYGRHDIRDYDGLVKKLMASGLAPEFKIPPIPVAEGQVMAAGDNASAGAMLRGLEPGDMKNLEPLRDGILETGLDGIGADTALVGYQLANSLGVAIGEDITLTTARGNITAFGTVPRVRAYGIGATFKTGMSIYDSSYVFMSLADAQSFLNMDGAVSHIDIFLNDPDGARRVAALISNGILRGRMAYAWQDRNSSFVSALTVERNVMFLILTLIILVASFNIISSLVMLTKDKSRDIAVLRTIGATKGSVMRIFFIAGSIIGVAGTTLGLGLGVLISENIEWVRQLFQVLTGTKLFPDDVYFLSEMPSKIDYAEVAWTAAMSLAISFLATLYPSRKAARMQPVEVLRYE